ncbi:MAG: 3-deoxy-7-phosphoheptulonate synthase [Myxococcota bacterium]|nr:3-deoxy-7-phosphoheptulonate synthase [Myxococcota bacterium]
MMLEAIDHRNVQAFEPLPGPEALKRRQPLDAGAARLVQSTRHAICDLLHGRDLQRLLVVVGPCSVHDPDDALEYARRLRPWIEHTRDALVVVMRAYFEKPRTTVGWKGFITDPNLDGSEDVAAGIAGARELLLGIHELGVPCASELLDPIIPQYLADLISWAAIGARTTESQTHRAMASGLSMPVGFKNGTDGLVETAVNAMTSAGSGHRFLGVDDAGRTAVVRTRGNPNRHLVLRGGRSGPNYGPEHVARAATLAAEQGVARPVMVDCSHDNAAKDHRRQAAACRSVIQQLRAGQTALVGVQIESHLEPGRQDWRPGVTPRRGVSITDACIGWDETETLLGELAAGVRAGLGSARRSG